MSLTNIHSLYTNDPTDANFHQLHPAIGYFPVDAAALTAITTMVRGDMALQLDTNEVLIWTGGSWESAGESGPATGITFDPTGTIWTATDLQALGVQESHLLTGAYTNPQDYFLRSSTQTWKFGDATHDYLDFLTQSGNPLITGGANSTDGQITVQSHGANAGVTFNDQGTGGDVGYVQLWGIAGAAYFQIQPSGYGNIQGAGISGKNLTIAGWSDITLDGVIIKNVGDPAAAQDVATKHYVDTSGPSPGGSAGGDLSGTFPNPTVAKVNGITLGTTDATAWDILAGDGSVIKSRAFTSAPQATSTVAGLVPTPPNSATVYLNGKAAFAQVNESDIAFTNIITGNVSSTKHGYAPQSPADATQFLNGATTPGYAQVKDSDLSTSDITTNNASTSKHGFQPKGTGSTSTFYRSDNTQAAVSFSNLSGSIDGSQIPNSTITSAMLVMTPDTIWVDTPNGHGSTGTATRTFSNVRVNNGGSSITYTSDATNGDKFTINIAGTYGINYMDLCSIAGEPIGITLNGVTSTSVHLQAGGKVLDQNLCDLSGGGAGACAIVYLAVNDVIRAQDNKRCDTTGAIYGFRIVRLF